MPLMSNVRFLMAAASSSPAIALGSTQPGGASVPLPLVAAGITVAGAILVAYLVHRWNGKRERKARFVAAATAFRNAFAGDLAALEGRTFRGEDPMEFLRVAHDERHAQAVIAFEPFLPIVKKERFRKDWQRYCYGEGDDGKLLEPDPEDMGHKQLYFLVYSAEWKPGDLEAPRRAAIERMKRLLTYAGET